MSAEPLDDLPELFAQAEELHGEARARFLAELAARSPELAAELASLLAAAGRSTPWLNGPAWRPAGAGDVPAAVGPYRVIAEVGRGGAGRVFLAEETGAGFVRQVAVKVLAGPVPSADAVARFRTEGRLLAGLEHPGIARLYDAGTTDEGVLFLAMEFIDGVDILQFAAERDLDLRARVELFLEVLEIVQFAHRQLIVHRDLKPANLLVDRSGRVKLLDFGIARLLEGAEASDFADSALTRTGQRWLTPAYASPEQIRGERTTTAADIYSLGVVLYELLTGRRPHEATGPGWEAIVLETEPEPPSRSSPGTTALKGDLDAITLRALRKEPDSRYRSVEAFGDDLRRYLQGFPVLARQGTRRYRWSKFVQRHRRSLAAVVAVFVALATGLGLAFWQAREAAQARVVAERRLREVQGLATAMIFEISRAIEPLDGSGPAMELTIDRALEYLERLEADAADDPALWTSLAEGYERVGEIATTLPVFGRGTGRWEKGMQALERAVALRQRLVAVPGSGPDERLQLALAWLRTCGSQRPGRDLQRAIETCDAAAKILRELVEQDPGVWRYRFELARALTHGFIVRVSILGAVEDSQGQDFDQANALWLELSTNPSADFRASHALLWGLYQTADHLRYARRPEDALILAQRAAALVDEQQQNPALDLDSQRIDDHSNALLVLGQALWDLDRPREALGYLERAYELARRLDRRDERQLNLIQRFSQVGTIARVAGAAGEVARGEQALVDGEQLLAAAAAQWSPATVTFSRAELEMDRGFLYRTAAAQTGARGRSAWIARARTAYLRAMPLYESLVANGAEDPFGARGKVAECREALAELTRP
ncbi:MAG: serine/threonine-protein kinase [Thermoanaerobaculia bacterium]|nr:serine/threonine-protein kinase [Thermoanaerobaculia bacterium]